MLPVMHDI
jgi:hypothetical protein